ncbi:DUF7573 domain-containing protein [Natronobeatus ordinarius]|uniref:DUF7573 domain-containing protein n=1 Tax=Natronobeatus ordinarius TaxID=2963433 RepID=UPI0020CF1109|nr:hypothetical protein [Natronobeatus ordinarius]
MTDDATLTDFLEGRADGSTGNGDTSDASTTDGTGSSMTADDGASTTDGHDTATIGEDDTAAVDEDDTAASDGNDGEPAVEPAVPTSAWGVYTCDDCGSSVERVWFDEGVPVCPACKSW